MDNLEHLEGIKIGGINMNNIRYADDTVLLADSEEKLQHLVAVLHQECRIKGLKINTGAGKTEVMGLMKENGWLGVEIYIWRIR